MLPKQELVEDGRVDCPALRDWIANEQADERNDSWKAIGQEVLARKTLWLTAAKELEGKVPDLVDRYNLAATDVFVEKAQKAIEERARKFLWVGGIASSIAFLGMICAGILMYSGISVEIDKHLAPLPFTIMVVKMATVGGLVAGAGYFVIVIARAFLHEGTVLYARRHALRFGRLYVYLAGGKVDFDDLERAFNWNKDIDTAFQAIRAEKAMKSILHLVAEKGVEVVKAGLDSAKGRKTNDV